ncbi:unnamed protein product [Prunus brigantina]
MLRNVRGLPGPGVASLLVVILSNRVLASRLGMGILWMFGRTAGSLSIPLGMLLPSPTSNSFTPLQVCRLIDQDSRS